MAINLTTMSSELSEAVAAIIVQRQTERAVEWEKRRAAKAAARVARKRARDAGLVARHAAKLARLATRAS